ncbi:MAG: hypothetical protein HYT77_03145 [Deltaproteobacteria bacterium]|nr:hypothetical protein [Deltaproteobacteria bacterium]
MSIVLSVPLHSAPGDLDFTFGLEGVGLTDFEQEIDGVADIAIQPDGKIIVVGTMKEASHQSFAVARFLSDGSLDTTFGNDGLVTDDFGGVGVNQASAVAVSNNGKIIVVGRSGLYIGVLRLTPQGAVNWRVRPNPYPWVDIATDVYTHPNLGNIHIAGITGYSSTWVPIIGCLHDTGTPCTFFGQWEEGRPGWNDANFPDTTQDVASSIAYDSHNERFILGGFAGDGTSDRFGLVQFDLKGDLRTSFGTSGYVRRDISGSTMERMTEIAVQEWDQKIVAVGFGQVSGNNQIVVARYNIDGTWDNSFSSDGSTITNVPGCTNAKAASVAIQEDRKIVVAGTCRESSGTPHFTLIRYNTNGSIDTTFGTNGFMTLSLPGTSTGGEGYAVQLQGDGRILVGGIADEELAVARYYHDNAMGVTLSLTGEIPTTIIPEQTINVGLLVQSDGPDDGSAELTAYFPLQTEFVSSSLSGCTSTVVNYCGLLHTTTVCGDHRRVRCPVGTLASGASLPVTLSVRPKAVGPFESRVEVVGEFLDFDLSNNVTSWGRTVVAAANLGVTIENGSSLVVGDESSFRVSVENHGPNNTTGVVLTLELSDSAIFESTSSSLCHGESPVICDIGSLASGASFEVELTFSSNQEGKILLDASTSSAIMDPDSSDNTKRGEITSSLSEEEIEEEESRLCFFNGSRCRDEETEEEEPPSGCQPGDPGCNTTGQGNLNQTVAEAGGCGCRIASNTSGPDSTALLFLFFLIPLAWVRFGRDWGL